MSNPINKTKKGACIFGIVFCSLLVIFAFCGRYFQSDLKQVANFFLGTFGMSFYGIMAAVIVACSCVLAGKRIRIPTKYIVNFILMFVAVVLFVQVITTYGFVAKSGDDGVTYIDFSTYTSYVYHYYDSSAVGIPTFGGVFFGIVAYALTKTLTIWGASIIILALLAWTVFAIGDFFYSYYTGKIQLVAPIMQDDVQSITPSSTTQSSVSSTTEEDSEYIRAMNTLFPNNPTVYPEEVSTTFTEEEEDDQPTVVEPRYSAEQARSILFNNTEPQQPTSNVGSTFFNPGQNVTQQDETFVPGYYTTHQTETTVVEEESHDGWRIPSPQPSSTITTQTYTPPTTPVQPEPEPPVATPIQPVFEQAPVVQPVEEDEDDDDVDPIEVVTPVFTQTQQPTSDPSFDTYSFEEEDEEDAQVEEEPIVAVEPDPDPDELVPVPTFKPVPGGIQEGFNLVTRKEAEETQAAVHQYQEYNTPPFELLNEVTFTQEMDSGERRQIAQAICDKLAVFGIKIEPVDMIVGPSVTRYMFRVLSQKTRMSDFKQYSDDIKACIEAPDDIRIEAPVHGTNLVGIEVANKVKAPVMLRSLLESQDFQKAKGALVFAIGQEITGRIVLADLAEMPHLLIAGTTGSGKSVCLNCMIVSMIYKYGPEYVRFVMVDPKFVELSRYDGIPHMLTKETITNVSDALSGMDYLIKEMDGRFQLFKQNHVGNITEYNSRINPKYNQKLPYLVFVVDELADLMSVNKKAFENKLGRLAQKSRAAGIHIVLATQRPDVNVITGTIKANLPCRMALKVASSYDSATIVGGGGAEKLLGKGDMLFMKPGSSDLERVQGAYVSNDEIRALVEFSISQNEVFHDERIYKEIFTSQNEPEPEEEQEVRGDADREPTIDPLCKKALRFWLERNKGRASIASIQRNLGIGFNRAGRIVDTLQKMKLIEEPAANESSSKPTMVLVTLEQLDEIFPDMEG